VAIIVGGIVAFAMFVSLWGALFTNVKVWGLFREQRQMFRGMPREQRRRIYVQMTIMYVVIGAYFALLIVHPFGLRNTFIYCLIVPFLVLAPIGTIVVGVRAARGRHSDRGAYGHRTKRRIPPGQS